VERIFQLAIARCLLFMNSNEVQNVVFCYFQRRVRSLVTTYTTGQIAQTPIPFMRRDPNGKSEEVGLTGVVNPLTGLFANKPRQSLRNSYIYVYLSNYVTGGYDKHYCLYVNCFFECIFLLRFEVPGARMKNFVSIPEGSSLCRHLYNLRCL